MNNELYYVIRNDICVEGAIAEAIEDGEVYTDLSAARRRARNLSKVQIDSTGFKYIFLQPGYTVVAGTGQHDHGTPEHWVGNADKTFLVTVKELDNEDPYADMEHRGQRIKTARERHNALRQANDLLSFMEEKGYLA